MTTNYETIKLEHDGPIAIVTLNRPEVLNALSTTLFREFYHAVETIDNDDQTAVIIVTGAGNRAFSAGADIKELARIVDSDQDMQGSQRGFFENAWNLANTRKPTIGALNGLCYGGGALMACSFDLRVGCNLTSFRFLAVTYGRINSTWNMPTVIGLPLAKELLYTGRVVDAEEAFRIGLLNRLVDADNVVPEALNIARTIAANDQRMVQGAKKLIQHGIGTSLRDRFDREKSAQAGDLKSTPVKEGFKDFLSRKGQS